MSQLDKVIGLILLFLVGVSFIITTAIIISSGEKEQSLPGFLEGGATVGPICPVEREGVPCPVPPEAYTSREVVVYKADGKTVVARKNFDRTGHYRFELAPGTYIVDIGRNGVDSSKDVPREVTIRSNETVVLDIDIDTGIR